VDKRAFLAYWLPLGGWMAFIFYMSSQTGGSLPSLFIFQDIVFHLGAYAVLGCLFARALLNHSPGMDFRKIICYSALFGLVYGVSDELHQLFVPGRQADFFDVITDSVGAFLGGLFVLWLK
jgi:VanZ family protein